MNIDVTKEQVNILDTSSLPHQEEYKITKCYFNFDEFTSQAPNKVAVFTVLSTEESVNVDIIDNECDVPNEVLKHEFETIKLGVYGYDVIEVDGKEVLDYRYSPSYDTFVVPSGSYVEGSKTSEMITPSQYDIYSAKLQEGLDTLDDAVAEIETMDIDAEKVGKITSITITRKDGTTKEVQLEDGMGLDYRWQGTSLGIKREDETEYQYVNLQGQKGEPGAIKMQIVNVLPTTGSDDTIYLVPIPGETGNNYEEYIYVNGGWEKIGGIQVEVDLSDYYTKEETDALIPDLTDYVKNTDYATDSVGGVFKTNGRYYATLVENGELKCLAKDYNAYNSTLNLASFISKGTLENVITGKGLVKNTDYATSSVGGVFRVAVANATNVNSYGVLVPLTKTYEEYTSGGSAMFIGKGTLENVITGKNIETANNKVTAIDENSTDTQYPTAKCMYDIVGDVESLLEILDIGTGAQGGFN